MIRVAVVLVGFVASACAAWADDKDPVKEKLFAAKVAYDKELREYRKQAEEWFDKQEDAARNDGNKKLVDQIKVDRKVFDEDGELPRSAPAVLKQRPGAARKTLETAYGEAIKAYTRDKKDDEAAAVEKARLDFLLKEKWRHVDLANATIQDDYVRISPQTSLPTIRKHAGRVEIVVVARTESENIRLDAPRGAVVIFNWEVNPRELRVCRPDGTDKPESGSIATAKATPLKPNTWYTLRWQLTEEGMQISVDGKTVFEERKKYDLSATGAIAVRSGKSIVDVKEFRVTPFGKNR